MPLRTLRDADMDRRVDRMRADKRRRSAGVVYFLRCESFVKVGYSENPKSRLRALEVMSPFPCEIIGTADGGMDREGAIHDMLRQWHHKGEWFHFTPEVVKIINSLLEFSHRPP